MRLFDPPPQRTAYFSSGRSPGVVLRVSRTSATVRSTSSVTHASSSPVPVRSRGSTAALTPLAPARPAVSSHARSPPPHQGFPHRTAGHPQGAVPVQPHVQVHLPVLLGPGVVLAPVATAGLLADRGHRDQRAGHGEQVGGLPAR